MANFGKITTFDTANGVGMLQPEKGGDPLRFERSALTWDSEDAPKPNQRLTYEDGKDAKGNACAVKLQSA